MLTLFGPSSVRNRSSLITLSQRHVKQTKMTKKPSLLPLKFHEDGKVQIVKLIRGYGPDEVDRFNKWLQEKAVAVGKSVCNPKINASFLIF